MKNVVWLYGNADGNDEWDWTRTREKAIKFATRKLRKETYKRGYTDDWEMTGPTTRRDAATGNTWVFHTLTRNGYEHVHGVEIHRCLVREWEGDYVRFLDPSTGVMWTVDPVTGDLSFE